MNLKALFICMAEEAGREWNCIKQPCVLYKGAVFVYNNRK